MKEKVIRVGTSLGSRLVKTHQNYTNPDFFPTTVTSSSLTLSEVKFTFNALIDAFGKHPTKEYWDEG